MPPMRKLISEMTDDELTEMIRDIRTERRNAGRVKRRKETVKKTVTKVKRQTNLTDEERDKLAAKLRAMLKG